MKSTTVFIATFLLIVGSSLAQPLLAQEEGTSPSAAFQAEDPPDIVVRVDGMACPFCAHGLKKKLEALDITDSVDVKLNEGEVLLFLKPDATVDDDVLRHVVKEAGFVVRGIQRLKSAPTDR
jgi:mercuric ion binding protein